MVVFLVNASSRQTEGKCLSPGLLERCCIMHHVEMCRSARFLDMQNEMRRKSESSHHLLCWLVFMGIHVAEERPLTLI